MLAMFGMGLVAPPKAQANGTGKILLGVAAGALIAGLIDSSRDCDHDRYRYARPPVVVYEYRDYRYWDGRRWHDRDDRHWDRDDRGRVGLQEYRGRDDDRGRGGDDGHRRW
jgi:hypothetical protein